MTSGPNSPPFPVSSPRPGQRLSECRASTRRGSGAPPSEPRYTLGGGAAPSGGAAGSPRGDLPSGSHPRPADTPRSEPQPARGCGRTGGDRPDASRRHTSSDQAAPEPGAPKGRPQCHRDRRPSRQFPVGAQPRARRPEGSRGSTLLSLAARTGHRPPHLLPPTSRCPPCPPRPPSTALLPATGRERGRTAEHHGIEEDSTPRPTAREVTGPEVGRAANVVKRRTRRLSGCHWTSAFRRRPAKSASGVLRWPRRPPPGGEPASEERSLSGAGPVRGPRQPRGRAREPPPRPASPLRRRAARQRIQASAGAAPPGPSRAQHARGEADHPGLLQDGAARREVPALRRQRTARGREAEAAQGAPAPGRPGRPPHPLRGLYPPLPRHPGPRPHAGGGPHPGKRGKGLASVSGTGDGLTVSFRAVPARRSGWSSRSLGTQHRRVRRDRERTTREGALVFVRTHLANAPQMAGTSSLQRRRGDRSRPGCF